MLLLDGHHHLLPSLFPRVVHLPLYLVITSLSVHPAFSAFRYLVAMSGDVRVCVYVLQHAWKLFDASGLVLFFLLLEIWIVFWFQFCDFQKTVLRNAFLQFFLLALWISSSLVSPSHAMATVFDCGSGMQTRL